MQHQQQDKRPLLSDSEEANELVSNDGVVNVLVMVMLLVMVLVMVMLVVVLVVVVVVAVHKRGSSPISLL